MNKIGSYQKKGFKKYLFNTSWLFGVKIFRIVLGLLISILLARYLGPEQFGVLSYAISFVMLFSVMANLGLEKLLTRELLHQPKQELEIMGSSFVMRLMGAIFLFCISVFSITVVRPNDQVIVILVAIISSSFLFKSLEILRYWFEAHVRAKYSAFIEGVAIFFSAVIKVLLILNNAPLVSFAWAVLAESVFLSFGLLVIYLAIGKRVLNWKPTLQKINYLLQEAWPLILAGTLYIVYTRVDQIMLGEMVGNEAVGVYAVAVKISEGWFFIPGVIATSLFPAMINSKENGRKVYLDRTQHLFNFMAFIGIIAASAVAVLAYSFIMVAFGNSYIDATSVLIIHIWGGIFVAMSTVCYRFLIIEGLQKYSFYRGLTGLIVNITLNLLLIPKYGVVGAAVSTVVSQIMALYLFNATNAKTRPAFIMQTKALFLVGIWGTLMHIKLLLVEKK